jgi:hypothetical protein
MTVGKVNKLMSAVHVRHELSNRIVGGGLTMSFINLHITFSFSLQSGGLDALNCPNAQRLLIAQLFIYTLPPTFF